jgi:hypothetical protein
VCPKNNPGGSFTDITRCSIAVKQFLGEREAPFVKVVIRHQNKVKGRQDAYPTMVFADIYLNLMPLRRNPVSLLTSSLLPFEILLKPIALVLQQTCH